MQPSEDARIDPLLTDISIAYQNTNYVWQNVFPIVQVDDKSAKYYVFDKGEWVRDEAEKRAPGGRSAGGGFPLSDDQYNCEEIAFHTKITDEDNETIGNDLDLETAKTNFVTEKIFIKAERDIAALCQTTGNWDHSITLGGTDQFDDYDDSDPIDVFETEIDNIESSTGQLVNTAIIPADVWRVLKHHPHFLARLSTDNLQTVSLDTVSAILGIPNIYVAKARYNDAKRGETDNFERIWDKHIWLGHVPTNPGPQIPSAGYTFVWPREGQMRGVRRWREKGTHSDIIEAFQSDDKKITGSDLGAVIEDAIS